MTLPRSILYAVEHQWESGPGTPFWGSSRDGAGGSAKNHRQITRRDWRRACAVLLRAMDDAGVNTDPDVWMLMSDATLVSALGPMLGSLLVSQRDAVVVQIRREIKRRARR